MARKNNHQDKSKKKNYQTNYLSDDRVVIDFRRNSTLPSDLANPSKRSRPFNAQTQSQGQFVSAIKAHILTFGLGPAGTGKTYCTAAMAAEALSDGSVERIVFTRPAVEVGESMGFLPGKLDEKFDPYFSAFKYCLVQLMGKGVVECALKLGNISTEPLAYMRGKTFNDAFVVLDEAQNCTESELKMFTTRIGKAAKFVINGDLEQSDIGSDSGLFRTIQRLQNVNQVYVHEFDYDDIVRSGIVKDILYAYSQ